MSVTPMDKRLEAELRQPFDRQSEVLDFELRLVAGVLQFAEREPGLAEDMLDLCPVEAVTQRGLGQVWAALHRMRGKIIDPVTVFEEQIRLEAEEKSRGIRDCAKPDAAFLAELFGAMVTPYGVRESGRKLAERLHVKQIYSLLLEAAGECHSPGVDPDDLAARLRAKLDGFVVPGEAATLGPLLDQVIADVQSGVGARPLPSPWENLNRVLKGGAAPGELVVLAGRPGLGKTALAGCWALEIAKNVGPVLFVSCEVKDKTLGARLLAREGKIDNRAFREALGNSAGEIEKMRQARGRIGNLPLRIVDSSSRVVRPLEVRKLARKMEPRPVTIVVDYLQLMYADDKHQSREREIADMSRAMKRLAVELNCPVLLLSQLNRKVEEGTAREPQLADLRESGAIEQDADIVIMLHSSKGGQAEVKTPVKALVRKGRSSGTGDAYLIFDKAHSDFVTDERGEAWRKKNLPPSAVTADGL